MIQPYSTVTWENLLTLCLSYPHHHDLRWHSTGFRLFYLIYWTTAFSNTSSPSVFFRTLKIAQPGLGDTLGSSWYGSIRFHRSNWRFDNLMLVCKCTCIRTNWGSKGSKTAQFSSEDDETDSAHTAWKWHSSLLSYLIIYYMDVISPSVLRLLVW